MICGRKHLVVGLLSIFTAATSVVVALFDLTSSKLGGHFTSFALSAFAATSIEPMTYWRWRERETRCGGGGWLG